MNLFFFMLMLSTSAIQADEEFRIKRSLLQKFSGHFHENGESSLQSDIDSRSQRLPRFNNWPPKYFRSFRKQKNKIKSSKTYFGRSRKPNRPYSKFRELYGRARFLKFPAHDRTNFYSQESSQFMYDKKKNPRQQTLKVIPGYTHMQVKVLPGEAGNNVILSSNKVGHKIVIGSDNSPQLPNFTFNSEVTDSGAEAYNSLRNESHKLDGRNNVDFENVIASTNSNSKSTEENGPCFSENCETNTVQNKTELNSIGTQNALFLNSEGSGDEFVASVKPSRINLDGEEIVGKSRPNLQTAFEGSGSVEGSVQSRRIVLKENGQSSGRLVNLFSEPNDNSTPCITPKDEPGHCRSFRDCVLHDVLNNFNLYLQYMCLIRSTFVGLCCPDNPVIEVVNPDENSTNIENEEPIQPTDGCGVNSKTRIVGGSISKPHEWTWMVAILKRGRFFCGGVLINNWFVLTAAHCTLGVNIKEIAVRLGEYDFNDRKQHQQDIPLYEIKRHAKFTTLTFKHDIALLRLKKPVQFTRFVGTICLPKAGDEFVDVNATVVGWGTVSFGGAASPILRQVTIPVWNNTDCDRTYGLEEITDAFMCAGSPDDEQDACQGDSGGPLMALNSQGRWQVIGLVSWGRRCGDPNFPGVYTRVTTYLDWIRENMH